jgi:hypothetical protein
MGSAQTAEFEWVSPWGVVTPMDMQKIEDQLERFADSPGHILHAKIIGGTRDGVVARASKKSPADIVRHTGNQRKSATGAQAATHPSSKLMRYGVDSFSPSSWEPQEEGMMNIAARFFPQLKNQGLSFRRGRSQYD